MKRRRITVVLVALTLAGVVVAVTWPRGPQPLRAAFEQVREGMTYDEVCIKIGGPPGDYSGGRCVRGAPFMGNGPAPCSWTAIDGTLVLRVDRDGRVRRPWIMDAMPVTEPTFLDRLRTRLGL